MADLKKLKHTRGVLKSTLTRASTFLDSENAHRVILPQLRERKDKVAETWEQFNGIQTKIEEIEEDVDASIEREEFEESYFDIISRFNQLIIEREAVVTQGQVPTQFQHIETQAQTNNLRLPKIELPTFAGGYEDWYAFYDTFHSLIHNVRSIPRIQKFHYLRSALRGDAATVIQSLEVSAANYDEAWQMLTVRYDNKRLIIQKHIKAIFELPAVTKENHAALRSLSDGALKHVRALKALGRSTDQWGDLLIYLITSKLDVTTNKEWENSLTTTEFPTLQNLTEFLERRCHTLEIIQKKAQPISTSSSTDKQRQQRIAANVATQGRNCPVCHGGHFAFACESLLKMSIPERITTIRDKSLCLNCLRSSAHRAKDCKSGGCKKCSKKHNTLLHITTATKQETSQQEASSVASVVTTADKEVACTSSISSSNSGQSTSKGYAWLSTAIVKVLNRNNKWSTCRALLDAGSQSNFVTRALVERLGLTTHNVNVPVVGVNQVVSQIRDKVNVRFCSSLYEYQRSVDCLVLEQITDQIPSAQGEGHNIHIPPNLRLADPSFSVPGNVDLLLGTKVFWEILCVGQIKATSLHPVLQKTLFGWILGGTTAVQFIPHKEDRVLSNLITNQELDRSLTKFWENERCEERPNFTHEERLCEEHFIKTFRRNSDGRFIVQLPFRREVSKSLGESRSTAQKRFHALERKLQGNVALKEQYLHFIREYIQLGHMEKIDDSNLNESGYYLPHHPVFKGTSLTTKLRVVFDASCKTSTGISLNDTLMVGPVLQPDLLSIILRFRVWQFVMVADIEKMYRQVLVDESQRCYQRILWREDPKQNLDTYQLNTITYGTSSASYLATRALQQIAHLNRDRFPSGSSIVLSDFYVDDLVTGSNSVDQANVIQREVITMLSEAGFNLRQWASNTPELLHGLLESSPDSIVTLDKSECLSTLGLRWHSGNDILQYQVKKNYSAKTITKRVILASIARIFDPLGLLGPIVVTAKIIMQHLWQLKIGWDESVPLDIQTKWLAYESQLSVLNGFKIPRKVIEGVQPVSLELHGFCDASMDAYGACVYVRANFKNRHKTHLLCAKSRVAPAKIITLPRLELCAAYLLAQLMKQIKDAIPVNFDATWYWSDSTITLGWIRSDAKRWSVFVSNRVSQIQELTELASWNHVKTNENPADLISRGVSPVRLMQSQLWWNGPPWLSLECEWWGTKSGRTLSTSELPEARKTALVIKDSLEEWNIFHTISTMRRLQRVVAYVLRFVNNSRRNKVDRSVGPLTARELEHAGLRLAKVVQGYTFRSEIKALQGQQALPRSSKLLGLAPFVDHDGVIRVGGRLTHSTLPYSTKHPIVLPTKHPFTKMLIVHEHERLLHAGPQATLASLRQRYWPISGRSAVRKVTRGCIKCFRAAPSVGRVIMANLPAPRITPSRPFLHCGIDYAGPFMIRDSKKRNSKCSKSYVAIFVCLACKAVHIELVFDLSTEAFLNAFKRFISRRGKPSDVYTDNGTNFVGAVRELRELRQAFFKCVQQETIHDFSAHEEIAWHFNPPLAPHFGGIWEAGVKAMKFHLKRVAGNALLNCDEMETLLAQIEAVLNSRPLTPLSSDPNDNTCLTPAHFLIGDSFTAPMEPTLLDVKENRLSRWQRVKQLQQHFWKKWSNEYLNELQQRTKWKSGAISLKPGQLVIVREDDMPPLCWPLARIERIHPGSDGLVRAATVRAAKGVYKRPATRLCPLPMDKETSN